MARRYDSFVLRSWQVANKQRVEIEHLQSGGRMQVENLRAALAWIDVHCGGSAECDPIVSPADDRTEEVISSQDPGTSHDRAE